MKHPAVQDPPGQGDAPLNPCPNCGFDASGHYCANCGQPNHLHEDTFIGLITHFVAHYFHYDSKFWRTLRALVSAPGKLTLAYQQKKRQSYIPPVSLYIFVSIVFFLLLPMFQQSFVSVKYGDAKQQQIEDAKPDSIKDISIQKILQEDARKNGRKINATEQYTTKVADDLLSELRENPKEFKERLLHSFPKIFFFMIPVLAALLKLFLIRQKKYYYVDHAVFALHMHSFVFIICIIPLVNPFASLQNVLSIVTVSAFILYYIIAIHRVYKSGWIKSTIIGLSTAAFYFIVLLLATLLDLWILFSLKR